MRLKGKITIAEKADLELSELKKRIEVKNKKVSSLIEDPFPEDFNPFENESWGGLFSGYIKLSLCNGEMATEMLEGRHKLDTANNSRKRLIWTRVSVAVAILGVLVGALVTWYFTSHL